MSFDESSIGESLHTALRKACDSNITSAAWNMIYILKPSDWKQFTKVVADALKDFEYTPIAKVKLKKYESYECAISDEAVPVVKKAILDWQPYGKGHAIMTLYCIFCCFDTADWKGFCSFLPYSVETKKEVPLG